MHGIVLDIVHRRRPRPSAPDPPPGRITLDWIPCGSATQGGHRGVAQLGRAQSSGGWGRQFESDHPDHIGVNVKLTTNQKGVIAEMAVVKRAVEKGWVPSLTVEGQRYDMILDDGNKTYRVQVKHADGKPQESEGSVVIHMTSSGGRYGTRRTYTENEIDALLVYMPSTDKVYWLSSEVFQGREGITLRLVETKNNQRKGVNFAEDYEW